MIDEGPVKLLFAGPVGAGKTTALRGLSDGEIVATEVPLFDGAMDGKETTTVALDYSTIELDDETIVHLYGVPGQEHFDFMRPIVADGALGAIILVDATAEDAPGDCSRWVTSLRSINPDVQLVVGISKTDIAREFSLDAVRRSARHSAGNVPVMCVDPRQRQQCVQLIRALLLCIDDEG
jgi:signal recognition particle receptor subunit beta